MICLIQLDALSRSLRSPFETLQGFAQPLCSCDRLSSNVHIVADALHAHALSRILWAYTVMHCDAAGEGILLLSGGLLADCGLKTVPLVYAHPVPGCGRTPSGQSRA